MIKEYVITFLNETTNSIKCDLFDAKSPESAIHDFKECYRHGTYKILSVVETGRL
jgi:hypothetical protein